MSQTVKIGIIGDYDKNKVSHPLTNAAIVHAAKHLSIKAGITWLPTPSFLKADAAKYIKQYDAFWASPGSPYESMEGALAAVRMVREAGRPFIGT